MDAFHDICLLIFRAVACVVIGLAVSLVLAVGGCAYMQAHFESDVKALRAANKRLRVAQAAHYEVGTKLSYYNGSGYWGHGQGTITAITPKDVTVNWHTVSGQCERNPPWGVVVYDRAEFEAWLIRDDGWAVEIE